MGIKKVEISMSSTSDILIDSGFTSSDIKTTNREMISDGVYYQSNESIKLNLSSAPVRDILSFSEFISRVPNANSIINFFSRLPSVKNTEAVNNSDYASLNYSFESMYNYHSPQYERVVSDLVENQIINAYVAYSNGKDDDFAPNRHFNNTILNRNVFLNVERRPQNNYLPSRPEAQRPNVIFPKNYNFAKINFNKSIFPYAIEMALAVDNSNSKFKNFLESCDFFDSFVKSYLNAPKQVMVFEGTTYQPVFGQETSRLDIEAINLLDVESSFWSSKEFDNTHFFVSNSSESSNQGLFLKVALTKSFLRKLMYHDMKTYEQIMAGEKCYSEVIFYKIEKSLGSLPGMPIQTFIVPADRDIIRYFDTQIKAGISYSYRISACSLVVGNSYSYGDDFLYNEKESNCTFTVQNTPSIHMMEVPIIEGSAITMAPPATRPVASFYTKNDSENKIFVRLNTYRSQSSREEFEMIQLEDQDSADLLRLLNNQNDEILFENKNTKVMSYEVFKTSSSPNNSMDFADNKVADINNNFTNSIIFSDTLRPNKKYYYVFRSVNHHNLKSNPSVVYEVELLRGSSTSKLAVKTHKYPDMNPDYSFINMKSLIQVIPATQHTMIPDVEAIQNVNSQKAQLNKTVLGIADYPIWGRKFKIRVTSNNTGRKIDFNMLFNLIKKKTKEETR